MASATAFRSSSVVKRCALLLILPMLAMLTGCAAMQVKLGMKVSLPKTPAESISVALAQGTAIAPGQELPLIVSVTQPGGKVLRTEGAGSGKVMWSELSLSSSVVTVNKKGTVALPKDPRMSDGKVGHVTVTVPSHPELRAELDIPPRYDAKFTADFSGSVGMSGMDGRSGLDGSSGSMGSLDPNNPSPGGNGGDGGNGTDGDNGRAGGDAPAVTVRVALQAGAHPFLQVSVSAAGKQNFYLVDPAGGSLLVRADGGPGGRGGSGGRGGRGGSGGAGTPSGSSGRDGSNGHDGLSGPDGRGGSITVLYDPQAKPYLTTIHLSNARGPKPVFQEQTVPQIW